jgi:D-proline reductase (dithiol) PrdB
VERLLEHVYEWNVRAYVEEVTEPSPWDYGEGPFVPLAKPLSEVRLGLLTATGSFVEGGDPEPFGVKNMTQEEAIPRIKDFVKAEPQLATIPWDTPREKLRVRHPGYDIRAVEADPNVGLPLDRLREFAAEGVIKETLPEAYSFVGATAQLPLIKKHAPRWAEMFREKRADAVLLVPV